MRSTGIHRICVGLAGLVLASCGAGGNSSSRASVAASSGASSMAQPIETTPRSTTPPTTPAPTTPAPTTPAPTTSPSTTVGPTVAFGPPAFDQQSLGDNLLLTSFILTVAVANTNSGQLSESMTTSGFIKDPYSAYELATFSSGGTTDGVRRYLVGGRSYEENQFGDWYLYEAGSASFPDYSDSVDLRSGTLARVLSADFDSQADFAGIPANHFLFDETDLSSYSSYTPERPSPTVEGDFYLAQEGNSVLYTHSKETSPGRTYEVTESLSSVGELAEITLPAELGR